MAEEDTEPESSSALELKNLLDSMGYDGVKPADQREHVIDHLMGKDWSEIEALEHNDYVMFPDKLIRRQADGGWETKDVMLRVPREHELRKARVQARELAKREHISEEKDQDLFANLENMSILAIAIRNDTKPHEPWEPEPLALERRYDKVCLQRLWEKVDRLNDILNPSPNQLSSAEIVVLIAAIANARNLGPLVVYGPGAQTSFVVSMVDLLLNSLGSKFSSASLGRLMQAS